MSESLIRKSSKNLFPVCIVCMAFFVGSNIDVFAQSAPVVIDQEVQESDEPSEELLRNIIDKTTGSAAISGPSVIAQANDEDVFFDSDDVVVPRGEMSREGPIKVDPNTHPGSVDVIVKKSAPANAMSSQLVSAERAISLGRYDSALEIFDNLHKKNKRDSRVNMGRAIALQKLGRFDEAMKSYEAVSRALPQNLDVKINMLGLLGTRYPSIALRRLIDLQKKHSTHSGVNAQLAIAYSQTGDSANALRFMGIAASHDPRNANHLFNMAVIADRAGKKKEAISYYEKSLELDTVHGAGRSIPRDAVYERLARIR